MGPKEENLFRFWKIINERQGLGKGKVVTLVTVETLGQSAEFARSF